MNKITEPVRLPARRVRGVPSRRSASKVRWTGWSIWVLILLAFVAVSVAWLGVRAAVLGSELQLAVKLLPQLKTDILQGEDAAAEATVAKLMTHTAAARRAGADPLWTAAHLIPWVGPNFRAASEVATSADDVARLGAAPLASVLRSLDWKMLIPVGEGADLAPLADASPKVSSAAHAVRVSAERLEAVEDKSLWPQVADPLIRAREQLRSMTLALEAASDATKVAPSMLGADSERNYLLMIQNNAEVRATGGMPGALTVLSFNRGKLALGVQGSASGLGALSPAIPVDFEQQQIYSKRLGQYMQDVNLTPDFPTAASTAQAIWERKSGQRVDGVISVDPIALGYILEATGPVKLTTSEVIGLAKGKLPTELNARNVVPTLLSEVYAKISAPLDQDAYFAGVAKEIFGVLSSGQAEAKSLIEAITRGAEEGRVLLWSGNPQEQAVIAKYILSGSVSGPTVSPAQFGVYFNDGTGAKMDFYVKRSVQLVEECSGTEYRRVKVRVTSINTAPEDAASSLPPYVTGGGIFGVPAGAVQTNLIAYGPTQANLETASVDGKKATFAAYRHGKRPVGSLTITLAPGESSTVDLTFGKIVQHSTPSLVVTPTVQPGKDVILASHSDECG